MWTFSDARVFCSYGYVKLRNSASALFRWGTCWAEVNHKILGKWTPPPCKVSRAALRRTWAYNQGFSQNSSSSCKWPWRLLLLSTSDWSGFARDFSASALEWCGLPVQQAPTLEGLHCSVTLQYRLNCCESTSWLLAALNHVYVWLMCFWKGRRHSRHRVKSFPGDLNQCVKSLWNGDLLAVLLTGASSGIVVQWEWIQLGAVQHNKPYPTQGATFDWWEQAAVLFSK